MFALTHGHSRVRPASWSVDLQYIRFRSDFESRLPNLMIIVLGDKDDSRGRRHFPDLLGGLNPVQLGKANVEQNQVGLQSLREANCTSPISAFRYLWRSQFIQNDDRTAARNCLTSSMIRTPTVALTTSTPCPLKPAKQLEVAT